MCFAFGKEEQPCPEIYRTHTDASAYTFWTPYTVTALWKFTFFLQIIFFPKTLKRKKDLIFYDQAQKNLS